MTLLDWARGPLLEWSLIIMVIGITWRLAGILLLRPKPDHSKARVDVSPVDGVKAIISKSIVHENFWSRVMYSNLIGYTFHIGLAIIVFLFIPHILFFESLLGFSWPGLANPLVNVISLITFAALLAALVRRLTHPVLKKLSNFDDYASWFVTTLPVVTGLMAYNDFGIHYETMLAVHILSAELLFVWLPFGKLGHSFLVFVSRYTTGMLLGRKGARV